MPILQHRPDTTLRGLRRSQQTQRIVYGAAATYACTCGSSTSFVPGYKDHSAFGPVAMAALEESAGAVEPRVRDFSDFACAGCGRAVRIAHRIHEFAMSSCELSPECVYAFEPDRLA